MTTSSPPRTLAAAVALAAAVMLGGCTATTRARIDDALNTPDPTTTPAPARRPSTAVTAFCGPSTHAPHWREQLATLADIGITATHGHCYTPPADYTVLNPGSRYPTQAEYLELAAEASRLGIGVIAYDPMFWTDPAAARNVWAPYIADGTLVAVDLGDEPSPADMPELNRRAQLVRPTGIEPNVIFIGGRYSNVIDQHRALPTACPTSDDYEQNAAALADAAALFLEAGCSGIAIDTTGRDLDGDGDLYSTGQIARARHDGRHLTLFTGVRPDNFPTWRPLVDHLGFITDAGRAVKAALA